MDDDKLVCRALARLIKSVGFQVEVFASAEGFLQRGTLRDTACLILDVRLPGISGLDLQRWLAAHTLSRSSSYHRMTNKRREIRRYRREPWLF